MVADKIAGGVIYAGSRDDNCSPRRTLAGAPGELSINR